MKWLSFFFASSVFAASASNWTLVSKPVDEERFFVDRQSLALDGKWRKAWVLFNHAEGIPKEAPVIKSMKAQWWFDCANRAIQEVQVISYDEELGAGTPATTKNLRFSPDRFEDVVPDSVGEALLDFVCRQPLRKR
jgi:hypothetical protein